MGYTISDAAEDATESALCALVDGDLEKAKKLLMKAVVYNRCERWASLDGGPYGIEFPVTVRSDYHSTKVEINKEDLEDAP